MSIKSDLAIQCFNGGFNCAQAVLTAYSEDFGLDTKTALKVSGAFGGGMGHTGQTCGAVSGALMVIGLKYGKFTADDNKAKEMTYGLAKEFAKHFKAEFGSVSCKGLLKYDISHGDELQSAKAAGVFDSICPQLVKRAVEIVEEIIGK